jgi:hypothetical protein
MESRGGEQFVRDEATQYGDARGCLQAAHVTMRQVKKLLAQPSERAADESAALLREVEVQLGCVAALLRKGVKPDAELRKGVEDLQREVAVLAAFFAGADKMLTGWLDAVRSRRGGYTERGKAAPLVLVRKLSVEG